MAVDKDLPNEPERVKLEIEGNEQEGQALGMLLASAIQNELIQQKRPGGLLA